MLDLRIGIRELSWICDDSKASSAYGSGIASRSGTRGGKLLSRRGPGDLLAVACPVPGRNHDRGMATTTRSQSGDDHRLRELVRTTQDIRCALQHGVPHSTARGWLRDAGAHVVTVDVLNMDAIQLQQEVLRRRVRIQ